MNKLIAKMPSIAKKKHTLPKFEDHFSVFKYIKATLFQSELNLYDAKFI